MGDTSERWKGHLEDINLRVFSLNTTFIESEPEASKFMEFKENTNDCLMVRRDRKLRPEMTRERGRENPLRRPLNRSLIFNTLISIRAIDFGMQYEGDCGDLMEEDTVYIAHLGC